VIETEKVSELLHSFCSKLMWLFAQEDFDFITFSHRESFKTKKREYLKDKINELETNSKNKNIRKTYRDVNEFKKSYQGRSNLIKDENGDLLADFHSIFNG
jgi:hypothetical protein